MRKLSFILAMTLVAFLLTSACGGGDSEPAASEEPSGDGPASSGLVGADTFLTFDGQRYRLREILLQADLSSDKFTEIGVATEANVDYEGELTVYRRQGDDASVYTFSPAMDVGGEEGGVPPLWFRWEPAAEPNIPVTPPAP